MTTAGEEFKVGWRKPESLGECSSDLRINRQTLIAKADELNRYVWLLSKPERKGLDYAPATEREYAERDEIVARILRMLDRHGEERRFVHRDLARIRAELERFRTDARQMKLQGTADAYADWIRRLEKELADAECIRLDHDAAERYARHALARQKLRPWPGPEKPRKYPSLVYPDIANPADRSHGPKAPESEPSGDRRIRDLMNEGPLGNRR